MQGFVQLAHFHVPVPASAIDPVSPLESAEHGVDDQSGMIPVRYAIISRRSRERAGLRYQRRGSSDSANMCYRF